jgi:pimeloyl-ACP methyl ester carboxylesterase
MAELKISVSQSKPATDYAAAVARVEALKAKDGPDVREDSHTRLWTHGEKTDRVIVYYHGYTNAPPQFDQMGQAFYERGYNVLVPRLPFHGLQDPLTKQQENLTAEAMAQLTQETVDIAQGLGAKVTISGLSAGGVMAAWAAQYRSDVDLAVGLAPATGLPFVPMWVSTLFRKMAPHLPSMYIWWDPRVKEKINGPPHAYPRFSTRGLAEVFRLGREVYDAAGTSAPAARRILCITSAFDTAVHLPTVHKLEERWRADGADLRTYEFPRDLKIWHDMIDPASPTQNIAVTYPVIMDLITQ